MKRILVVGASIAGVHAAEALRDQGFDGELTIVGAENTLPYDRPPLSKAALAGAVTGVDLLLRPAEWYADRDIELVLGRAARNVNIENRSVTLEDGAELPYDGLVLATGSAARRLDSIDGDTDRIRTLRTASDSVELRQRLIPGSRLLVIGAGFIGLEVAATARELGVEVTVVEIGSAPLVAALGAEVGGWFDRLHERHGVAIHTGRAVLAVDSSGDGARVRLDDGALIYADTVVAGVGAVPMIGWLRGSGLDLAGGGVRCDAYLRASAPRVVAAGDIAYWHNELFGESMRVEHWTTAVEQGRFAALTLLGINDQPYVGPPYFWTDQFGTGTRTIGSVAGADRICVQHEDDSSLVALYGRGDTLWGAVCVNSPRALLACRRAVVQRLPWEEALTALKELTSRAQSVTSAT
ncbi:MAG: NAD(P)/FAD-dependent oxidoreductase [Jatrophihabitantaceae bacterium]